MLREDEPQARSVSAHLWAAIILLALVLGFFWSVTFGGLALLPADNLYSSPPFDRYAERFGVITPHNELINDMLVENLPWKRFARESLARGQLPLWNPYIFAGTPFLAAAQQAVLYPLGILFYLLPVPQAYGWFSALHLFLGGLFMYFFLRVIGASWLGGLVGGIAFAFSGFVVVSLLWPMVISTLIWLPLLLLCLEKIIRAFEGELAPRSGLLWGLIGAIALGLQFLAGHVEFNFYLLFTMAYYAAGRLLLMLIRRGRLGRPLLAGLALLGLVVLGFGLGAAQLVPFIELMGHNYRSGQVNYEQVVGWALPRRHLIALVLPDFFGNPAHHDYFDVIRWRNVPWLGASDLAGNPRSFPFWGIKNYVEGMGYLGILPLLLAGVAFLCRRRLGVGYVGIFGSYAIFSLLVAFGTPLYAIFFFGVPGFSQLHSPFRWLFPYSFSLCVLAGLGMTALTNGVRGGGSGVRAIAWGATLGGAGLVLLLAASRFLLLGASLSWVEGLRTQSPALEAAFPSAAALYSYQFRNLFLFALFLLGGGLVLGYALRGRQGSGGRRARLILPVAAVGLLVIDLFSYELPFNSTTDPSLLDFTPPSLARLQEDGDLYRIASFNYDDTLKPNLGMLYGLQDARGYDAIILKRYTQFWSLIEEPHGLIYSQISKLVEPASLSSPLLDLLGVKYLLTTGEIGLPGYSLVYRGEINIYRNEDVMPRAFAVFDAQRVESAEEALAAMREPDFDPRRTVVIEDAAAEPSLPGGGSALVPGRITTYEPNRVIIDIDMPQEGYLVLADSFYPGWRARSEGQELPIRSADYAFRAVRLEGGPHRVTFEFSPFSFKLGLYLSFLAVVVVIVGFAFWAWRWVFGGEAEASGVRRIAKNALTPVITQLINRVIDFGFAIFMLRLLGPENVGKYVFAVVLIGYFSIVADFGLGTLLTREVARERSQANRYLSNTVILRLTLSLLSLPLILGIVGLYAWMGGLSGDTALVIALLAVTLFPGGVSQALSAAFYAHERMEYPAAVTVVTTVLKVALGVMVLLLGWGIVGLAGVSVAVNLATAAILLALLWRLLFRPRLEADAAFQRGMVGEAAPLMINNMLATVFFRIDVMFLTPMKGDVVTGWYTTAYRFVDGLLLIPAFFTTAIFPVMSRYAAISQQSLVRAFALALKALLIVALPITVGTTLIADQIIPLFFGEAYAPSIIALQILIWFLPFSFVNSVTQYALIAVNQQRFLTLAFVIGASFNAVANLMVIPAFGFQGAAVVTILSELVLLAPFWWAVRRYIGEVPLLSLALRPTLAAAAMGGVLLLLPDLNWLAMIGVGALVYGVVLVMLRTFDREDVALLRQLRVGPRAIDAGTR